MSLPESHIKERLHSAYVRAIVSHAEQNFVPENEGDYGIDGIVKRIEKRPYTENGKIKNKYIPTGDLFNFQLKATKRCRQNKNGEIVFTLDNNAHIRFSNYVNGVIPAVLIVYDMPDDIKGCVIQDSEKLQMMGCSYWKFMDEKTLSKKTVYIPSTQVFNADAVNYILDHYKKVLGDLQNVS